MTSDQEELYAAAMMIGAAFLVGGATWTYYAPPAADGITSEPTLTGGTSITAYVVQEKLPQYGLPLPAQPVAAFRWRANFPVGTSVATGGVISNGTLAFALTGLDTYQGWPTSLAEPCAVPAATSGATRVTQAGYTRVTQGGQTRIVA